MPLHPGLGTLRDCRRGLATPPDRVSARIKKTRKLRNEISAYRSIARPHRCPFAPKRLCDSYAAPSNVSATTAAALRTDGAASLSIPCCAARSAMLQRAAPRARGPRAAHHEPGAREPESVAASVQFSRRPSTRERPPSTPSRSQRRRIDGARRRGAHARVTRNAGAPNNSASGSAGSTKREKKLQEMTT